MEQPSKKQKIDADAQGTVEVEAVEGKAAMTDARQSVAANGVAAQSAGW